MSNCDVVFQMGSFNSWCKTHESKADTERQCCMTGLAERAEAAEARASELAAQLATVNTLAHTRLQKIEYLETSLEACRDMQHNAESRVNELQEWYNESVRRNEASAIGAQILENNLNDALAQLATAQAALEQVTQERDDMRKVLDYWLHHARFLTGDYHKGSEYNLAVESLRDGKLNDGIEP